MSNWTFEFDPVEHSGVCIDLGHHMIHEGLAYFISDYQAGAGTYKWTLVAPNTATRCHVVIEIDSAAAGSFKMYHTPSINVAGSAMSRYNCNRNGTDTPALTGNTGVGTTSDGTLLRSTFVGSSAPAARFGGNSRTGFEMILKQGITYLFVWTPVAGTNDVAFNAEWYEV